MQSYALKLETKHIRKSIVLSKAKSVDSKMVKQKTCGVVLAICGAIPIIIENDVTAFIFLSLFFLPMIFGKQYIMTFNESKYTGDNTENKL